MHTRTQKFKVQIPYVRLKTKISIGDHKGKRLSSLTNYTCKYQTDKISTINRFMNTVGHRTLMINWLTLNLLDTSSQRAFGSLHMAPATFCIFKPCSSVPVDRMAVSSSPFSLRQRCTASASRAEYKCPMCGATEQQL